MYNTFMTTMTASQARAALPDILDRVERGEEVTITRHGEPVAVVLRHDAVRTRRADQALADAERLRSMLERARSTSLSDAAPIAAARADELVAAIADARAAR
jgi:prevent-host-death family protein